MTEVEVAPSFGTVLKDGFKPANVYVANNIAFFDDVQAYFRERSAAEKRYSAELSAIAKKYYDKKAKKSTSLSVGDTPTMTPGSLESASMTTWSTILTKLELVASEHDRLANEFITKIADPIKDVTLKLDAQRKRQVEYAEKLEKEKEAQYAALQKVKTKYDSVCQDVESKRKKSESAFDKAKAQSSFQHQLQEMNNMKNTYLIAINVTNKQKEKHYHEFLPEVMDNLQDLAEFRTMKLNGFWSEATQLEFSMLQNCSGEVDHMAKEIVRNEPQLDSMMYMQHNAGAFQEPPDKVFEPSPVWHDDDSMVTDEPAKVFLRNVLNKSKGQLGELRREVDKKRREVEASKRVKQRVLEGIEKAQDEFLVLTQLFLQQEDLHQVDRKRLTAEVETSTITSAVGDVTLGAKSHNFKSQTFKIPTNCDLCGERIWGLSAKGFDCRDCGYTCHSKCEMKVPAECPGELNKEERKKYKQERQEMANTLLKPSASLSHVNEMPDLTRSNTVSSVRSGYAASAQRSISGPISPGEDAPPDVPNTRPPAASPTPSNAPRKNRILAPPPPAFISELPGSTPNGGGHQEQKAKMLYTFEAGGEGEISVPEGRELVVLEPDTGSGWTRVRAGYKEGNVPTAYIEILPPSTPTALVPQHTGQSGRPPSTYSNSGSSITASTKKKGPAVAPRRGAKKLQYVEALYDYQAGSDTEHSMTVGERFVLIKEDQGDGWAEVEKGGVTKSVPANYVQAV